MYQVCKQINEDIKMIREEVFMKEQGFLDEFDDIDDIATHILYFVDESPVGTCRFFDGEEPGDAHIGRMAVLKAYRGKNLGAEIMLAAEKAIQEQGYKICSLSAQVQAKGFYEKLGYVQEGEEYLDEHCPHILMRKTF